MEFPTTKRFEIEAKLKALDVSFPATASTRQLKKLLKEAMATHARIGQTTPPTPDAGQIAGNAAGNAPYVSIDAQITDQATESTPIYSDAESTSPFSLDSGPLTDNTDTDRPFNTIDDQIIPDVNQQANDTGDEIPCVSNAEQEAMPVGQITDSFAVNMPIEAIQVPPLIIPVSIDDNENTGQPAEDGQLTETSRPIDEATPTTPPAATIANRHDAALNTAQQRQEPNNQFTEWSTSAHEFSVTDIPFDSDEDWNDPNFNAGTVAMATNAVAATLRRPVLTEYVNQDNSFPFARYTAANDRNEMSWKKTARAARKPSDRMQQLAEFDWATAPPARAPQPLESARQLADIPTRAHTAVMNEAELDREITLLRKRKELLELRRRVQYLELENTTRTASNEPGTSAQSYRPPNTRQPVNQPTDYNNHGERPRCSNCRQHGHTVARCPFPGRPDDSCFRCGEMGHNRTECPNEAFTHVYRDLKKP